MSLPDLSAAPQWFRDAVNAPTQSHFAPVDDTRIHYLTWNAEERSKPDLVLVHGFRAHARWWSLIAPFLTDRFRVLAFDFSGMGDSGTRPAYDADLFVRDLMGAIDHAQCRKPILLGHSFGGHRVLRACAEHPDAFSSAIVLDSYVNFPADGEVFRRRAVIGPKKLYPTYEAARARFRLIPDSGSQADYILDYVAHHSIKREGEGWCWKFDDAQVGGAIEHDGAAVLERIEIPMTIIHGEFSDVMSADRAAKVVNRLKHARGPISIPLAHHHVMLDQPLELVSALRGVLY
jgi:pimeloyl-ACP methyl ester carboxylesterase